MHRRTINAGVVMVRLITFSGTDIGFKHRSRQTKDNTIVSISFFDYNHLKLNYSLSTQHKGARANNVWLRIMKMCPSRAIGLLTELSLFKDN